MPWPRKQGSVGEDKEAVAISSCAVAEEAGEVVAGPVAVEAGTVAAGSAVAGEAEQDVVWYKDADI